MSVINNSLSLFGKILTNYRAEIIKTNELRGKTLNKVIQRSYQLSHEATAVESRSVLVGPSMSL